MVLPRPVQEEEDREEQLKQFHADGSCHGALFDQLHDIAHLEQAQEAHEAEELEETQQPRGAVVT